MYSIQNFDSSSIVFLFLNYDAGISADLFNTMKHYRNLWILFWTELICCAIVSWRKNPCSNRAMGMLWLYLTILHAYRFQFENFCCMYRAVIISFFLDTDTVHTFKVPYQFAYVTVISFDYNAVYIRCICTICKP